MESEVEVEMRNARNLMSNEDTSIKDILWRIASNLATVTATVQALEHHAKQQGLDPKELVTLHNNAKADLEIVLNPLFAAITRLDEREVQNLSDRG